MIRRILQAAALAAAALFLPWQAQAGGPADPTRGEALAEARGCAACHGPRGVSPVPLMPSLAGQQAEFLVLQMILFREGLRQVPAMVEPLRGLTDRDLADIAAWYASLPSAPEPDRGPRDPALAARGAEISAARHCGACHLPDYSGRANVPRINHQREDYLIHTLAQYRDNLRIGADTQMNGLMYGLSNQDIRALAHYLAHRD
ncbi:MAG: c-type cytochrome [Rhodovarius sp.]|nr:cytochrome c4 [Rhodovarius sp.]MCX7932641.1 cytochrome c4 [Rhodovarius sp.]MDW8314547.1 c-type cytochrome [Rhodovarius sp.]